MNDDRLDRMLRAPEAYFAECEERAKAAIEREMAREAERRRERERQARAEFRRGLRRKWLRWRP